MWAFFYGISQFVITDKVVKYEVDSVYGIFTKSKSYQKKTATMQKYVPLPLIFLAGHFLFFFVMHCIGVMCWHSYWFNIVFVVFVMQWAIYQGACYYMDYFAKKYEKQLQQMDEMASQMEPQSATLKEPQSATSK